MVDCYDDKDTSIVDTFSDTACSPAKKHDTWQLKPMLNNCTKAANGGSWRLACASYRVTRQVFASDDCSGSASNTTVTGCGLCKENGQGQDEQVSCRADIIGQFTTTTTVQCLLGFVATVTLCVTCCCELVIGT